MKTISVLFTQNHSLFAKFFKIVFKQKYDHVSLSITPDRSEFYSFNFKGFAIETFEKLRRHKVHNSMLYEFQVPENVYDEIKEKLEAAKQQRKSMRYAFWGIFLCFIGLPFHFADQYFCSEFVAGLLIASNAVLLQKSASSYLPEQLRMELDQCCVGAKLINVV